jgi:hypothetical protein
MSSLIFHQLVKELEAHHAFGLYSNSTIFPKSYIFFNSMKSIHRGVWSPPHFVICFLETKNAQDNLQTFNSMFNVLKVLPETPPSKFKLDGDFDFKQIEYVKFTF